jgi:hypothetical protein
MGLHDILGSGQIACHQQCEPYQLQVMGTEQAGHRHRSGISPACVMHLAGVAGQAGHVSIHVAETPTAPRSAARGPAGRFREWQRMSVVYRGTGGRVSSPASLAGWRGLP